MYYNDISLAEIQEKCMNGKIVILGDFNGRCGRNISDVLERFELPKKYCYDKDLPDPVEKPNGNAEKLLKLCKDTACLFVIIYTVIRNTLMAVEHFDKEMYGFLR